MSNNREILGAPFWCGVLEICTACRLYFSKGASPDYFGKNNVIVTFRGGGGVVVVLDVL